MRATSQLTVLKSIVGLEVVGVSVLGEFVIGASVTGEPVIGDTPQSVPKKLPIVIDIPLT